MTATLVTVRWMQGAAAALVAASLTLAVWPPSARTPSASARTPSASADAARTFAATAPEDDDPALREAVVNGDVFAASHSAPAVRWSPAAANAPAPVAALSPAGPADSVPALLGTLAGPDGATALLRLDATTREARIYREGERDGGYRVVRIEADRVTLQGPEGQVRLTLKKTKGTP